MKKRIHIWVVIMFFGLGWNNVHAQSSLTIEASQNVTNFSFTDSEGNKDFTYNHDYSGGYALGYRYDLENGLYFPGKIGMRQSGATYVLDGTNYWWRLRYSEIRAGIGYKYDIGRFGVHFSTMGYFSYLLKATQRKNNEFFDLKELDKLKEIDFGIFISPGVDFTINEYIGIYIDLNFMRGFGNLEKDPIQKANNYLFGGTLGLTFTIK